MKKTILLAVLFAVSLARAERYLVELKDPKVFAKAHVQMRLASSSGRNLANLAWTDGDQVVAPFANVGAQVENSFEHLRTMVVNVEGEQQIQELKASGYFSHIEREIFHPAPRPVQGFHRTQAWDYNVNYAGIGGPNTRVVGGVRRPIFLDGGLGPKTPWGISAVRAPQVWAATNQGVGIRVLVLDTGIDRDHPALKQNFEQGKDFTGQPSSPYEFADTVGHGSHCSGTIAAALGADGFTGVAPRSHLLAGRVCTEQGCSNIAVVAGLNWAIQQHVDVVSMSLGGPVASSAELAALKKVEAAGISVVAASGNDGKPKVLFPAAFPGVIAVGAIDKYLVKAKFSNWGPELTIVGPGVDVISTVPRGTGRESGVAINGKVVNSSSFSGSVLAPTPLINDLVISGLGKPGEIPAAAAGKFAFIQRGEIPFADKVKNAIAAGAAGVLIYNNEPGLIQGSLGFDAKIPVVMVEQNIGEQIKTALGQGQKVQAALQIRPADFASFSGTSMATPHVAGVVALIRAANHRLTPPQIKALVRSSAQPMQPNTQNELGAGLVNAESAVRTAIAMKMRLK